MPYGRWRLPTRRRSRSGETTLAWTRAAIPETLAADTRQKTSTGRPGFVRGSLGRRRLRHRHEFYVKHVAEPAPKKEIGQAIYPGLLGNRVDALVPQDLIAKAVVHLQDALGREEAKMSRIEDSGLLVLPLSIDQ